MHLNTWTANNKHFVYIVETGICAEIINDVLRVIRTYQCKNRRCKLRFTSLEKIENGIKKRKYRKSTTNYTNYTNVFFVH